MLARFTIYSEYHTLRILYIWKMTMGHVSLYRRGENERKRREGPIPTTSYEISSGSRVQSCELVAPCVRNATAAV